MDSHNEMINELLDLTAKSLERSFEMYWPANDRNDPAERNLSLHFGHSLLTKDFFVFAEAKHQQPQILGIDMFAIAPDRSWFLGCEFKRLSSIVRLSSLASDIKRLCGFIPRTAYSTAVFGPMPSEVAACSKDGYGLVAGLHWVSHHRSSTRLLDFWTDHEALDLKGGYAKAATTMRTAKAQLLSPIVVIERPTGSRYYLLAASFPICPELSTPEGPKS